MNAPVLPTLVGVAVPILAATVILLLAGALARCLRSSSAAARHLVWRIALLSLLLIPFQGFILPAWRPPLAVLPDSDPGPVEFGPSPLSKYIAVPHGAVIEYAAPVAAPAPAGRAIDPLALAGLIWIFGVLAALAPLGFGFYRLRQLRRRATPAGRDFEPDCGNLGRRMSVRAPVRLLIQSRETGMGPVTWGYHESTILLPAGAAAWPTDRRESVLLHELAHVARADWPWQLIGHFACIAYWFHPLAWWAFRRLRLEAEFACDDRVLQAGVSGPDYAEQLLEVARSFSAHPARTPAITMTRAPIEARIRAILASGRHGGVPRLVGSVALTVSIVAIIPLAVTHPSLVGRFADDPIHFRVIRFPMDQTAILPDGTRVLVTGICEVPSGTGPGKWTTADGRDLPGPPVSNAECRSEGDMDRFWTQPGVAVTPGKGETVRRYAVMVVGAPTDGQAGSSAEIRPSSGTAIAPLGGSPPSSYVFTAAVPKGNRDVRLRIAVPDNQWIPVSSVRPSDFKGPVTVGSVTWQGRLHQGSARLTLTYAIAQPQVRLVALDAAGRVVRVWPVRSGSMPVRTWYTTSMGDLKDVFWPAVSEVRLEARGVQWVEFAKDLSACRTAALQTPSAAPHEYTLHYLWLSATPKAGRHPAPLTHSENAAWKAALSQVTDGDAAYVSGLRAVAPDYEFRTWCSGSTEVSSTGTVGIDTSPVAGDPCHLKFQLRMGVALGWQSRLRDPRPGIPESEIDDLVAAEEEQALRSGVIPVHWTLNFDYVDPHIPRVRSFRGSVSQEGELDYFRLGETRVRECGSADGSSVPPYGFLVVYLR